MCKYIRGIDVNIFIAKKNHFHFFFRYKASIHTGKPLMDTLLRLLSSERPERKFTK